MNSMRLWKRMTKAQLLGELKKLAAEVSDSVPLQRFQRERNRLEEEVQRSNDESNLRLREEYEKFSDMERAFRRERATTDALAKLAGRL